MISETNTTTVELLTVSEAATKYNVSTRTIERHALLKKYKCVQTFRNSRKVNGYSLEWLEASFGKESENVGLKSDTSGGQKTEKSDNVGQSSVPDMVNILSDQVSFLKKEIEVKNNQLEVKDKQLEIKDNHITSLIESEKNTKMLLADLQIQNKALQLPEAKKEMPTAKPLGKKSRKIWVFVSIVLFIAITASAYAYNYYYGFKNLNWW
jgi:hypothetical protein